MHFETKTDSFINFYLALRDFPNHKIVLRLPSFGYEDLLLKLVFALKTPIGVGSIRYSLLKLQGMERYFHCSADKTHVYVETNPNYSFEQFSE